MSFLFLVDTDSCIRALRALTISIKLFKKNKNAVLVVQKIGT